MKEVNKTSARMELSLAYAVVWSLQLVITIKRYSNETTVLTAAMVLALTGRWPGIIASHVVFIALRVWRNPHQFNSDIWSALLDSIVVILMLSSYMKKRKSNSKEFPDITQCAFAVRRALGILYFAAGFAKMNTSHLNPATSCSTIFLVTLATRLGFGAWPLLLRSIAKSAGIITILVECLTGICLFSKSRKVAKAGAFLGLALHTGISLSPPPNNIVAFSVISSSRYFFVIPHSVAAVFSKIRASRLKVYAAYIFFFVLLIFRQLDFIDTYALCFILLAPILIAGLLISDPSDTKKEEPLSTGASYCLMAIFMYAFVFMLFGVQDMGNTHMFSNLRLLGKSNHLILPNGLLQKYLGQEFGPGPFDGGVIRIVNTTNTRLAATWPYDVSYILPNEGRAALRSIGHSGREFLPLLGTIFGPRPIFEPTEQYATHAFELRRMIADAHRLGEKNFTITYAHLPKDSAPNNNNNNIDWQRALDPPDYYIRYQIDQNGQSSCLRFLSEKNDTSEISPNLDESTMLSCMDTDVALQPWPPKGPRILIFILTKLLVYNPLPLLPGTDLAEIVCCDG